MIYSVKGILIYKEALFAVVECGGVGFKCYTTTVSYTHLDVYKRQTGRKVLPSPG